MQKERAAVSAEPVRKTTQMTAKVLNTRQLLQWVGNLDAFFYVWNFKYTCYVTFKMSFPLAARFPGDSTFLLEP